MKKYIQCTLKENHAVIMNVESLNNIRCLDKSNWIIKEIDPDDEIDTDEDYHLHVCENAQVSDNGIVNGNARVYGKAKVCGNALVYAHSELRGDAIATTKTYNISFLKWNVTLSDNHIQIGCKQWEYEKFLRLNEIYIGIEYSQEEYSRMENAKNIIIETIRLKLPDLFEKEEI